jgi:triacylglycerol lipase
MLALLQRTMVFLVVAFAAAWAGFALQRGWPVAAALGALLIVFVHASVLAVEFLLLRWVNRDDPAPRATRGEIWRAWRGEVRTWLQVFAWRQPFRSKVEPDHLPAHAAGRRGVLLVHGFACNRGLWNPWLRRLREADVPCIAVTLEPVFGTIDDYAPQIDEAVRHLQRVTGRAPVIVAHSMGGLALRAWLCRRSADAQPHSLITVGSPHAGTWFARFGYGLNARQMRVGCEWLTTLLAGEASLQRVPITCFYSHCDNIVSPASTATLPHADNRHLRGMAHVQMLFHDDVFRETLRQVAAPEAALAEAQSSASPMAL